MNNVNDTLVKAQKLFSWNAQKIYYSVSNQYKRTWTLKRGEVYFVDLGENVGSEENKIRPVVVLQSDAYNFKSPVFICAILTTSKLTIPDIQIKISGTYNYYDKNKQLKQLTGIIDLGQIKTIAKERIISKKICFLSQELDDINKGLLNVLGLSKLIISKENTIRSLKGKIDFLQKK